MLKYAFSGLIALSMMATLGACGEKIESSVIMGVHWKCDLEIDGDRTGATEDFMFHQSGQVNHIIFSPGNRPVRYQAVYKVDGAKFEITDRVVGTTMIVGDNSPSFVGKFTRTEASHMEYEGVMEGTLRMKVKGNCVPATSGVAAASGSSATLATAPVAALAPAPATASIETGKKVYEQVCTACHASGVAGAPKLGDKAAWAPRLREGTDVVRSFALKGKGVMPPKGGYAGPDADVIAAVDYMVSVAKQD